MVSEVSDELEATPAQVALAWLRTRPGVVLPIVGSRKASQIKENLGALEVELSEDQRARLDEASAIELGFPHDFINRVRQSEFVLGEARDRIDSHRSERSGLPLPG